MTDLRFLLLYSLCLGLCLAAIQALQRRPPPPPPPPVEAVQAVAIALPPKPEGARAASGAGEEGYRYTEEGCEAREGELRDLCFHQLAMQRSRSDLEGGLLACARMEREEGRMECQSDVAEGYALVDRDASLAVCPGIGRKKWRDQCVFGIALAYAKVEPEWAFRRCDEAGQWRDFCRHDVNGEIAEIDVDLALAHCAAEEGDLLRRKSCWHGIGKYLARVDVDAAFAACARVPAGPEGLYRENCIHGLGWGASESAGAAFLASCGRAGPEQDSCRLGVAYNLVRFDPVLALEICGGTQRADLRGQCEAFVRTTGSRR
jgi:hypothetical protein